MWFLFFDRDSIKEDNKPKYENYGIIFIVFIMLISWFQNSTRRRPRGSGAPSSFPGGAHAWARQAPGPSTSGPCRPFLPVRAGHYFRSVPAITSGPCRPLLPVRAGHYFRSVPAISSGPCRPLLSAAGHYFRSVPAITSGPCRPWLPVYSKRRTSGPLHTQYYLIYILLSWSQSSGHFFSLRVF
jgi:hypothetical protein